MKKTVFWFLALSFIIVVIIIFWQKSSNTRVKPPSGRLNQPSKTDNANPSSSGQKRKYSAKPGQVSLFITYWNLPVRNDSLLTPAIGSLKKAADVRKIYFGIAPDEKTINKNEDGHKNLTKILPVDKNSLLVLRLTNDNITTSILSDKENQIVVAKEATAVARQNGFGGILLDLESSILPTEKVTNQINAFVVNLSNLLSSFDLKLAMALYGDQFYRPRPYDIKSLNQSVDEFFIMAYDLHKSYGQPGPNFPLDKGRLFDYDLKQAVTDFTSVMPAEKLTFVFGMYGYDWTVDEKKRPIKRASSLTLNQIRDKFLLNCSWENCLIKRDDPSQETEINYVDSSTRFHTVWFEDESSVEKKIEFLKTRGIVSYAFWAYGYY